VFHFQSGISVAVQFRRIALRTSRIRLRAGQAGSGRSGPDHLSLHTAPQALSGGQQRRLALAVQLIRQPHLLLMDEPTAGLIGRSATTEFIAKLKKDWTLLLVTHDAGNC